VGLDRLGAQSQLRSAWTWSTTGCNLWTGRCLLCNTHYSKPIRKSCKPLVTDITDGDTKLIWPVVQWSSGPVEFANQTMCCIYSMYRDNSRITGHTEKRGSAECTQCACPLRCSPPAASLPLRKNSCYCSRVSGNDEQQALVMELASEVCARCRDPAPAPLH
jgi:hypothetical protein